MTTTTATEIQIATIQARRVDATARAMMSAGLTLTHEQADEIGEEGQQWIRDRLGLAQESTDRGVTYTPATEIVRAACLNCGRESDRTVPLDEGSNTQTAVDACTRCGSHDVRDLGL